MPVIFILCVWMFTIVYDKTEGSCEYKLSDRRGEINSPNYPNNYQPEANLHCEWKIYVGENETITIQFLDIAIDNTWFNVYRSCYDYLAIYDGPTSKSTRILVVCGFLTLDPIVSSGNVVTLIFHATYIFAAKGWNAKGFHLNWRVTDRFIVNLSPLSWHEASETCTAEGGHLAVFSDIASPSLLKIMNNIPDSLWLGHDLKDKTPNSYLCYTIRRAEKELKVEEVQAEERCEAKLGFICQKEAVICGETFTTSSGTILSPNYPRSYSNDLYCMWEVSVFKGYSIVLVFYDVDLEISTECSLDYVEVLESSKNVSTQLQKICDKAANLTVVSSSNKVIIKFRSDPNGNGRGFFLEWRSEMITTTASTSKSTLQLSSIGTTLPSSQNPTDINTFVVISDTSSTLEDGAVAGIVLGGLFIVALVTVLAVLIHIRHKRRIKQRQKETEIRMHTCKDSSKEECIADKNQQDIYSKPLPKELREQKQSSSERVYSVASDPNCYNETYNHLNETDRGSVVPQDVINDYGKLQTKVDLYDQTNESVAPMHSCRNINDTYDHLSAAKVMKDENELHRSLDSSKIQNQEDIMEPEYDHSQSGHQSNVIPQNTYAHFRQPVTDDGIYGYSDTSEDVIKTNNIYNDNIDEADIHNEEGDLDDDTYYNLSGT